MALTTARDKVLYWIESSPQDTPPWDDLHDLLREYDALESAAIDALKRGRGRGD